MSGKKTVGVIGLGHVGSMTADRLAHHMDLVTYDVISARPYPGAELAKCDFVVVCVNTPALACGTVDLSQVEGAFEPLPSRVPVILRSTVPPGTTDALAKRYGREVIFWPEYVGETRFATPTWRVLAEDQPFQLVGAWKSSVTTCWLDLMAETFGPLVRLHRVDPAEAELAKYMENSWFAVKVTFVNEFRRLAEGLGLDWQSVREGWLLDPRVERDHSDAFASEPGYSGKCLPKDVAGIIGHAAANGIDLPLLTSVKAINDAIHNRRRDDDG
ncbi:Rossmann-fold NAD(P)-binding domain-containing protein [Streptomyces albogriseolus]|uniref:hypothetical protein n=1 Tax=Streptomyces albogriseolus TaxID=1887 RepID=UPI0036881194